MESDLKNALQAVVLELVNLSEISLHHVLNYTVGDKPSDNYLMFDILRVEPEQITVCGGGARYQWIAQLTIAIRDNTGVNKINDFIDLVRAQMPVARQLTSGSHTFKVVKPANAAPPITGDGWYKVPVSIRLNTLS